MNDLMNRDKCYVSIWGFLNLFAEVERYDPQKFDGQKNHILDLFHNYFNPLLQRTCENLTTLAVALPFS